MAAIDRKNAALVAALAGGATVAEAARQAGLSESSVYRRRREPDFRREVAAARTELLTLAVGRLADAATAAVATLRALLDAEADSVRLGAARAILDAGMKGAELVDLAERVATLEERQAAVLETPVERGRWTA
jgi:hypothetical protein